MFRFCALLLASIFLFNTPALRAQETDYLKHGKIFCLCSFKKTCSECYECDKNRYQVKIENHLNKQIKKVHYQYYSDVYNRIVEKEAKIQGKIISAFLMVNTGSSAVLPTKTVQKTNLYCMSVLRPSNRSLTSAIVTTNSRSRISTTT